MKKNIICGYIDDDIIDEIEKLDLLVPENSIYTKGIDYTFTTYQIILNIILSI